MRHVRHNRWGRLTVPVGVKSMGRVAPGPQLKADPMSVRKFSPNHALHLPASSVCSCVAPAFGSR